FGSPRGAMSEAARALEKEGYAPAVAHMRVISPFPEEELAGYVAKAKYVLVVEQNANGQLQALIESALFRQNAGGRYVYPPLDHLRKYNGVPLYPVEICRKVKETVKHGSQRQAV